MTEEPKYKDREWLYDQYWNKKKSTNEISNELNISRNQILRYMNKLNISRRSMSEAQNPEIKPLYKNKEWLYDQYITNKKSSIEISDMCNCSKANILRWLKKFKIKRRSLPIAQNLDIDLRYKNKEWLYEQYIVKLKSTSEIGKKCKCNKITINRALKKFNIPIRNHIECQLTKANKIYRNYDWLYEQYILKERTASNIAKECNTTHSTIINWLKKFNILIRNNSINNRISKRNYRYKRNIVVKKCLFCGIEFKGISTSLFCSKKCNTEQSFIDHYNNAKNGVIKKSMRSIIFNYLYNNINAQLNELYNMFPKYKNSSIEKLFWRFHKIRKEQELKELQEQGYEKYLL